ncbi:hypothetical protein TNCV_1306531 [Trichonephila clavipes]|nr:hypothetical protein TNCV_1306531 [Trichonephila clavipes]
MNNGKFKKPREDFERILKRKRAGKEPCGATKGEVTRKWPEIQVKAVRGVPEDPRLYRRRAQERSRLSSLKGTESSTPLTQ